MVADHGLCRGSRRPRLDEVQSKMKCAISDRAPPLLSDRARHASPDKGHGCHGGFDMTNKVLLELITRNGGPLGRRAVRRFCQLGPPAPPSCSRRLVAAGAIAPRGWRKDQAPAKGFGLQPRELALPRSGRNGRRCACGVRCSLGKSPILPWSGFRTAINRYVWLWYGPRRTREPMPPPGFKHSAARGSVVHGYSIRLIKYLWCCHGRCSTKNPRFYDVR